MKQYRLFSFLQKPTVRIATLFAFGLLFIIFLFQIVVLQALDIFRGESLLDRSLFFGHVAEVVRDFFNVSYLIHVGVVVLVAFFSYILADVVVGPLRKRIRHYQDFIPNVMHELKTPLAIIKLTSDMALHESKVTKKEVIDVLRSDLQETERILAILKNLRTLAEGEVKLSLVSLNLITLIHNSIERLRSVVGGKHITIKLHARKKLLLMANASALEELILNLLKNAYTYTPTAGSIVVEAKKYRKHIRLIVRDTGRGISPCDISHIFTPHYRGENARSESGSGLGLSIVQEIARQHNATIAVKSVLGKGTAVIVDFPETQG